MRLAVVAVGVALLLGCSGEDATSTPMETVATVAATPAATRAPVATPARDEGTGCHVHVDERTSCHARGYAGTGSSDDYSRAGAYTYANCAPIGAGHIRRRPHHHSVFSTAPNDH